jgi:hypothetical protein
MASRFSAVLLLGIKVAAEIGAIMVRKNSLETATTPAYKDTEVKDVASSLMPRFTGVTHLAFLGSMGKASVKARE